MRFVAFFLSLSYPTRTKNKIKLSRQQKIFCNFPFYFQMFSFSFRQQTLDTIYFPLISCSQYDEKILPYQVSFDVKGKLFNFCSYDSLEQLTILLWWWQLVSNNEVNKIILLIEMENEGMGRQSLSTVDEKFTIILGEASSLSTLTHISNSLTLPRA